MKRLVIVLSSLALAVGLAAAGAAASSHASKRATIVIRHQMRGCHAWSVNGGAYRPTQTARLAHGGAITFVDNDVMPHKLVQTSGPAARFDLEPGGAAEQLAGAGDDGQFEAEPFGKRSVAKDTDERLSQPFRVLRLDEQPLAAVLDQVEDAAGAGRDDAAAPRERLDHDPAEAFVA